MLKFSRAASLAAAAFASAAGAQSVSFATLPPGSILHAQASVIAKVVQDHSKLQVRVNGYDGDAPILDAVNTQKADFLLLDVGEVADAYKGQGDWKGKPMPNLRTAITLYGSQMAFWVKKDSGIDSIAGLKGKRVPSEWAQQTGVLPHTTALLNAGGITYNDVVKVPEVNVVRAADDFKAGRLDLLFFPVGAPKVAEVAAAVGGLRLPPPPGAVKVYKEAGFGGGWGGPPLKIPGPRHAARDPPLLRAVPRRVQCARRRSSSQAVRGSIRHRAGRKVRALAVLRAHQEQHGCPARAIPQAQLRVRVLETEHVPSARRRLRGRRPTVAHSVERRAGALGLQ